MSIEVVDTPSKTLSGLSYCAAGVNCVLGWLVQNEAAISVIALLIGIILGIGTFIINWYYQHKRISINGDKR